MVKPTPELIEVIFLEKVAQARRMSPEERLSAVGDLFETVCERLRAGIRWQFPDVDDQEVEAMLRERLEIARRLERLR